MGTRARHAVVGRGISALEPVEERRSTALAEGGGGPVESPALRADTRARTFLALLATLLARVGRGISGDERVVVPDGRAGASRVLVSESGCSPVALVAGGRARVVALLALVARAGVAVVGRDVAGVEPVVVPLLRADAVLTRYSLGAETIDAGEKVALAGPAARVVAFDAVVGRGIALDVGVEVTVRTLAVAETVVADAVAAPPLVEDTLGTGDTVP